jgi:hypothetical protein
LDVGQRTQNNLNKMSSEKKKGVLYSFSILGHSKGLSNRNRVWNIVATERNEIICVTGTI